MSFFLFFANQMEYQNFIFLLIHALGFSLLGLCIIYFKYNAIYFIKGSNSLTVIKKSFFNKEKKIIYRAGELEKVKLDYSNDCSNNIVIILTNGNKDHIISLN